MEVMQKELQRAKQEIQRSREDGAQCAREECAKLKATLVAEFQQDNEQRLRAENQLRVEVRRLQAERAQRDEHRPVERYHKEILERVQQKVKSLEEGVQQKVKSLEEELRDIQRSDFEAVDKRLAAEASVLKSLKEERAQRRSYNDLAEKVRAMQDGLSTVQEDVSGLKACQTEIGNTSPSPVTPSRPTPAPRRNHSAGPTPPRAAELTPRSIAGRLPPTSLDIQELPPMAPLAPLAAAVAFEPEEEQRVLFRCASGVEVLAQIPRVRDIVASWEQRSPTKSLPVQDFRMGGGGYGVL